MLGQLPSDERFEELLERAEATGQNQHALSQFEQPFATLAHGLEHFEFVADIARLLKFHELCGGDADQFPSGFLATFAQGTHQPDASSAEYHRDTAFAECVSNGPGGFMQVFAGAGGGAAIDGDPFHRWARYPPSMKKVGMSA